MFVLKHWKQCSARNIAPGYLAQASSGRSAPSQHFHTSFQCMAAQKSPNWPNSPKPAKAASTQSQSQTPAGKSSSRSVYNRASQEDKSKMMKAAILSSFFIPGKYQHLLSPRRQKIKSKYHVDDKRGSAIGTIRKQSSRQSRDLGNSMDSELGSIQHHRGAGSNISVGVAEGATSGNDEHDKPQQIISSHESADLGSNNARQSVKPAGRSRYGGDEPIDNFEIFEQRILSELQTIITVENLPSKYLSSLYWTIHDVNLANSRKKAQIFYSIAPGDSEKQEEIVNVVIQQSAEFFNQLLSSQLGLKHLIKLTFIQILPDVS